MGRGPRYNVAFRRRREGKTNYRTRRRSILSSIPRLVTRNSLKHTLAQIIIAKPIGDQVLVSSHSSELTKKFDWLSPCGNTSSAYLTGLLVGYRAQLLGITSVILDIGLQTPSRGSKVFAVLKGALDARLKVSHANEILPDENRINGGHIALYAKTLLLTDPELYKSVFFKYISRGLNPEQLTEHFEQVKKKINETYQIQAKGDKYV